MIYRILTDLSGDLRSFDAKKVDWAHDGSGIWIRDTSGRDEDFFIPHARVECIRKVRDDAE